MGKEKSFCGCRRIGELIMSKVRAYKKCDKCGKVVAQKGGLFFQIVERYVTVKMRNHLEGYEYTDKLHYCMPCWRSIVELARVANNE